MVIDALHGVGDITDKLVGGHSASEAAGVKKNGQHDWELVMKGVTFSVVGGGFCLALWVLLARQLPAVYKFRADPELDGYDPALPVAESGGVKGLWEWCTAVNGVSDEEVIRIAGLDSFMLCEFHRVCRNILLLLVPVAVMILCPLHYFFGRRNLPATAGGQVEEMDFLARIGIFSVTSAWDDPEFLKDTRGYSWILCWTHVAVGVYIVLLVTREIANVQHRFLSYRFKWLRSMPHKRASTVMVERIPRTLRSDEALNKYFAGVFSSEAIERAYVVRKASALRHLTADIHTKTLALEAARQTLALPPPETPPTWWQPEYWRKPVTQQDVDALEAGLKRSQEALALERARVEQGVKDMDLGVCSSSGFVTFSNRRWSRLASREQLKADAWKLFMSTPPEPEDVRYEDLERNPAMALTNEIVAGALTFGLFVMWFPVTVFLTSLTSLDALLQYKAFLWLVPLCDNHPGFKSFLESVLATLVLKIFLAFLPSLLLAIIYRFLNLKGGRNAQLMMQNRYFTFLMVFVVLVSALSKTLIHTMEELLSNPNHVFVMVGKLPNSSDFYISYLVLGWFTECLSMLRLSPLFWHLYSVHVDGRSRNEARAETEPEDQDSDGMGARMAVATIMMTIPLVFASCSPIIVLSALVYFALGHLAIRFRVLYTETRKPDLGGAFWVLALRHLYLAVGLYVMLMTSLLVRAPFWHRLPAWAMALSAVPLGVSYFRFSQLTWEVVPFEDVAKADLAYRRRLSQRQSQGLLGDGEAEGEYYQVECGPTAIRGCRNDEEEGSGASSTDKAALSPLSP